MSTVPAGGGSGPDGAAIPGATSGGRPALPGLFGIAPLASLQSVGEADVGYCADGVCYVPGDDQP